MVSKKYIPILSAALVFLLLEFLFFKPAVWGALLMPLFLLVIIFIAGVFLLGNQFRNFWRLIIQILFLNLSGVLFFLFLKSVFLDHFLFLGLAALDWFLFENIYRLLYQPRLYQPFTLEKISFWLNLLIIFWFFGGFNILNIFLNLNFALVIFLIFLVNCWLGYYFFWSNKFWQKVAGAEPGRTIYGEPGQTILPDLLIISLILTEFYFILLYLPTQFYFNSLILAILYIIIVKLWSRSHSKLIKTI